MITSKYGPPFNEGNFPKDEWVRRKNYIETFIKSQTPTDYNEQIHNPELFILEMLMDLWVALKAEEEDAGMYALSLSTIYDDLTGGLISYPNTKVEEVLQIIYQRNSDDRDEAYQEGINEGRADCEAGEDW